MKGNNEMERTRWYKNAVIYQIYPRSFMDSNGDGMGDIPGIISKLDYLKNLGITAVWLSPVYESPQHDNGYDIADYRKIYGPFGTMEDFKKLIAEMHSRGIKLIMDLVANHTSNDHMWFKDALNNPQSPYRDYYFFRKGKRDSNGNLLPPNNWTSFFSGPAWERVSNTSDDFYLRLFAKEQPDVNWDNPKVREEYKNVMKFWLDLGVDGFRCDVITIISKVQELPDGKGIIPAIRGKEHYINGPRIHEFLKELNHDVLSNYDCMTVGESVLIDVETAKKYVDEKSEELDMVFEFEHMDIDGWMGVKWFLRKFNLLRFKSIISKWQTAMNEVGWNSLYIENHDQPRACGRFGTDAEKYHDQSSKMLATMMYFQKGTPYIYQGQEIGMTNTDFTKLDQYEDVETHNFYKMGRSLHLTKKYLMKAIKLKSRDNGRTPVQWDNTENGGFSTGKPWLAVNHNYQTINVKKNIENPNSVYHYFKKIIELRKLYPVLINGLYTEVDHNNRKLFVYERAYQHDRILVICNFTNKTVKYTIPKTFDRYTNKEVILSVYDDDYNANTISLKPYGAVVYNLQK